MTDIKSLGMFPKEKTVKKETIAKEYLLLESGKDLKEIKIVMANNLKNAIKKAQAGKGRLLTKEELKEWIDV